MDQQDIQRIFSKKVLVTLNEMSDDSLVSVMKIAEGIFSRTTSNRTLETIFANCLKGKISEFGIVKILGLSDLACAWPGEVDCGKYDKQLDKFDIAFGHESSTFLAEIKSTSPKNKHDRFFCFNLAQHRRGINLSNLKKHPEVSILVQTCVNELSNSLFEVYPEYVFTSTALIFEHAEKLGPLEDYEYRLEYSKAIALGFCFKIDSKEYNEQSLSKGVLQ